MSDQADELDELRGLFWIELQDIAAKQEAIPDDVYWLNLAAAAANAVHKAGWRKVSEPPRSTVTPEQVEAAAKAGHALDAGDALPYWSWDSSVPSRQKLYRDIARAAAHAFGLSVAEDGEQ